MICDRRSFAARAPWIVLPCLVMIGLGCGSSPAIIPPLWLGLPGDRLPASTAANVFWVEADIDGDPGPQVVVDTGAPIALLHVESFNGAVPLGSGQVAAMTIGGTTLWKVPTYGDHDPSLPTSRSLTPTGLPDGGLIGFTVFGQFEMSFNYRDDLVVIGAAPLPDGVLAPVSVPFSLEGGGVGSVSMGGDVIQFPASRVVVPVTVEGRQLTLLIDTGASWVGLRTNIYGSLIEDGRGQLTVDATLAQGMAVTNITRLRSVIIGGLEVTGAVGASAASVDGLMSDLSYEVGHQIDGLLGAPYLREFYVTVDYPNRTLRLYRFADQSYVLDDYRRVGIELSTLISPTGNSFAVRLVYPGTDAELKGIHKGDILVSIDGQFLFGLDAAAVDRKLRGSVGTSRQLQFAGSRTVDVLIDELLPLP